MLSKLAREGRLDDFWRAHSVDLEGPAAPTVTIGTPPSVIHDETLVRALEPVLALLKLTACGSHSPSRVIRLRPRSGSPRPGSHSALPYMSPGVCSS